MSTPLDGPIEGRCYYCGPYEVEPAEGDPGPGEIMSPWQATAIFSRHMATESHKTMATMAAVLDAEVYSPRRFNPEEYA